MVSRFLQYCLGVSLQLSACLFPLTILSLISNSPSKKHSIAVNWMQKISTSLAYKSERRDGKKIAETIINHSIFFRFIIPLSHPRSTASKYFIRMQYNVSIRILCIQWYFFSFRFSAIWFINHITWSRFTLPFSSQFKAFESERKKLFTCFLNWFEKINQFISSSTSSACKLKSWNFGLLKLQFTCTIMLRRIDTLNWYLKD